MADGSVPLVLSPEPFSREVAYLEQPAGRTIKAALLDAVRSGAIDADDLSRTVVYVDGQRLERDQTLDRVLVEGQIINVVVEPMGGGGRKDIGQILMTIAVIAVSMWIGGGGTALGTTLLARVAAAVVLTLGQAAVAAIFAPETENQAKVNERYALQTASNQYRPWAPMPLALGEVVVAPDFAAKTYTQSIGDDVWLHGILGLHYGPCTVADLKIGDTLASSMGPGDFRLVEHLTPGPREFTIYQNDPDQADFQEELEATTSSATPIVRAGSAEGERFDFDFFLPGGLHFQKDDGRVLTASVTVNVRYRPVDDDGNPTGDGAWSTAPAVSLSSKTKDPMRITRSIDLPKGRYEFEFVRSLKPDDNEKRRDRIALTAIRSIAFRKAVTDETLSIIEFAVRATALNQGTLAPITCRIIPVCETWNGTTWGSPAPTSNPAALMRWLMTGPAPALPLQPAQADARLRAWAELCDEYDWRAGIYLLEERRQDQVIALLEQAGRASLFWDGRQLAAVCWVEKPAPVQLFANSNLRDHRWTIVYPDPVHAFRVEFQNIEEGGDPDELYVYADGYAETAGPGVEPAVLVEALRLEGQKTPERAYRDGRWELGARLHRRRIDTWTLDAEHLVSGYGARVRLAWQRVDGGTSSRIRCRRWSGGLVSGVRLAHPVEMLPGESYAVDLRLKSGVATSVPVINEADDAPVVTREIQFAVPRAPEFSPKRDDLVAFGVPSRVSEDTEIIGVEPGEGLSAVLTGVRYVAPLLMAGETGPIPPLMTRLSRQRQANPPTPRLLGVQPDPSGVRVSFSVPPWSGSPIIGFAARWRQTPAAGQEASWLPLPALTAGSTALITPPPRALPVAFDDDEGATLIDVELRAITESGQSSPEPMMVSAIQVREDPFAPTGMTVTPATRVAPSGSSHGVLVVSADPLAAAQGVDLVLEVRRVPLVGPADEWESAGLPLAASNPTGDILGLRSGERYGVRGAWRSASGWLSGWTDELQATVPAGSNVSDGTNTVDGVGAPELVARLVDAEALVAATDAAVEDILSGFGTIADAIDAAEVVRDAAIVAAGEAVDGATSAAGNASLAAVSEEGAEEWALASQGAATQAALEAGSASTSALQSSEARDDSVAASIISGTSASTSTAAAQAGRRTAAALLPSTFEQGGEFFTEAYTTFTDPPPMASSSYTGAPVIGEGVALRTSVCPLPFGTVGAVHLVPGRTYELSSRTKVITNPTNYGDGLRVYSGFTIFAADGAVISNTYLFAGLQTVASGAITNTGTITTETIRASFPTAAYAKPLLLLNYRDEAGNAVGAVHEAYFLRVTDVTERVAAAAAASAAAASAATSVVESSEASDSAASARISATAAASVSTQAINPNPRYTNWPNPSTYPTDWGVYADDNGVNRVAGPYGGYAMRLLNTPASVNAGVYSDSPLSTMSLGGHYVIEAEVQLVAGALNGSGIYVGGHDNDGVEHQYWAFSFYDTIPIDRTAVPGPGVVGQRYRYSRLIEVKNASVRKPRIYCMNQWVGMSHANTAKTLDWCKALIRPATPAEVAGQVALPALAASVALTQEVVADLETNYALAHVSLAAVTSGGAAVLSLTSDVWGTVAGLNADQVYFGDNTIFDNATDTLRTVTGTSQRVLALGAPFGTTGDLIQWEGASSVAFSAMSRANARFYSANAAPYLGGTALPGGPVFTVTASAMAVNKRGNYGSGTLTTPAVTLTPANATGAVTYAWSFAYGDEGVTANSATSAVTTFSGDPGPGDALSCIYVWSATDAAGKVQTGQVYVVLTENDPGDPPV